MVYLSLSLLGGFEAALDGEPAAGFESTKARALLAFLAVEADRPHRRESLAGLLWPERPEQAARHNLRHALSVLRKAIGDRPTSGDTADPEGRSSPFLLVTRETIQFNATSDHWLDVAAFKATAETGQEGRSAIRHLEEAVALYRGSFLEGFSVKGSPAFEDWALLTRERLLRLAAETLQQLVAAHERHSSLGQACEYARRWVKLEPWQEEAHRQLIRLLASSGQRGAALAQYEACRRALTKELGVEPTEETTALYESICDGEIGSRGAPDKHHNLPASLTPFVGREAYLTEIAQCLQAPGCRLLTLVGPGGSGKTRLAVEAAREQIGRFEHGVFFASLASVGSVGAMVPTVAQALGFTFYQGRDLQLQLLDYLQRKRLLLVLDNMEHLLTRPFHSATAPSLVQERASEHRQQHGTYSTDQSAVGLITDILKAAPQVKVVVTSRERLNVQSEHLLPVEGMAYPPFAPDDVPSEERKEPTYSAVQLFLQSVRRVRRGYEPSDGDLAQVERICRLVQGMPLGILLAATWVGMLTPEEIADEIADQFPGHGLDFLQSDLRDLPERQRSMRAVFDHSWHLLTQREQEAFQGLSVFRGGFTRQAAQQVTGVSAHGLMALATKSLLQRTPTGRYEMHELLRQYAAEKLGQSRGGGEAVRGRHCDYYTSSLKVWAADLKGAQQQAALAEIECEIENVHVAWDWAVERVPEQVECLDRSLDGLCMFYQMRGRLQEGEAACQKVATGLRDGESAAEMRAQARALAWQSTFSRLFGHIEPACRLARRALKLLSELQAVGHDVRREEAFALRVKGVAEAALGEREEARRSWQKSLALCRALDDRWEEANVRDRLGWVATTSCLYDKAERQFEKSLEIRRALGDARGIAESLISLGSISWRLGRLERAERMHREAITIREEIGDRIMVARGYHYLGLVYAVAGRQADRCPLEERALAIHDEVGYPLGRLESLISLGYTKQHLGEYREAHTYFQTSLAVAREMSNRRMILSIIEGLGELELAQEAYTEAVPLLQESLAIRREIGFRQDEMLLLIGLGCALRGLGDHRQMQRHIRAALRIATELSAWVSLVPAVCAIALLLADRGESARAIELYALALRYPRIANSRWWDDVVGKHIAAAVATLPPDVVTAAQERGRARELDATMKELLVELEQEGKP